MLPYTGLRYQHRNTTEHIQMYSQLLQSPDCHREPLPAYCTTQYPNRPQVKLFVPPPLQKLTSDWQYLATRAEAIVSWSDSTSKDPEASKNKRMVGVPSAGLWIMLISIHASGNLPPHEIWVKRYIQQLSLFLSHSLKHSESSLIPLKLMSNHGLVNIKSFRWWHVKN